MQSLRSNVTLRLLVATTRTETAKGVWQLITSGTHCRQILATPSVCLLFITNWKYTFYSHTHHSASVSSVYTDTMALYKSAFVCHIRFFGKYPAMDIYLNDEPMRRVRDLITVRVMVRHLLIRTCYGTIGSRIIE